MTWIPVLPEFGLGCDVFAGFVSQQGESLAPIISTGRKVGQDCR